VNFGETQNPHLQDANEVAALWLKSNKQLEKLTLLREFFRSIRAALDGELSVNGRDLLKRLEDEVERLVIGEPPEVFAPARRLGDLTERRNRAILGIASDLLERAGETPEAILDRVYQVAKAEGILPNGRRPRSNRQSEVKDRKKETLQTALSNFRAPSRKPSVVVQAFYVNLKRWLQLYQAMTGCSDRELADYYLAEYLPFRLGKRPSACSKPLTIDFSKQVEIPEDTEQNWRFLRRV
jgi:hypothetical protein